MAIFLLFTERSHRSRAQVSINIAGSVDIGVVVVDQIAVLFQIQVAFDDVHTDGVDRLPESKKRIFRVADAAAPVGGDHGQRPFSSTKGEWSTFFFGG